ncbi:hypothetical protein CDD82_1600 [Ophiocordyceps australis]|uniref:AGC-kinase C-terminal domain-containing protein n=1 Tax=Ophiocordyceps australis TaxID=1399860 RepID=A0A2C5ZVG8_9HYPO|nr:hypothetical protein CDD82_1600 [Ophiocordyceps australis]
MLSHLRFHRRGASNPASPTADQQPRSLLPLESPSEPLSLSLPSDLVPPSSSSSALPPTLPPIARVTSLDTESLDAHSAPRNDIDGGFIGGVALWASRQHQSSSSGQPLVDDAAWQQPFQAPSSSKPRPVFSLNMASDSNSRPADAPPLFSSPPNPESQRGRKSLPFLKNPMSTLLMRRKHGQNVPQPLPLSLAEEQEAAYDPRIRGTRVHDFSAPRRKQISQPRLTTDTAGPDRPCETGDLAHSEHSAQAQISVHSSVPSQSISSSLPLSSEAAQTANDDHFDAPPVPPKDNSPTLSRAPSSSAGPEVACQVDAHPSTRTVRSQDMILSEISALPKHMKSTSSRFSFDMIGAAKQEKLLEERHRQRQLEKQTASGPAPRDSRFDDFDDDTFDYDAMMDDDGLEEQIPGVNVDLDQQDDDDDDDLDDPDNDQENFAGFVFSRSHPASSISSPQSTGILTTPRDAQGNAIGYALTKDTPSTATYDQSLNASPAVNDKMPEPPIQDDLYFNASDEFAEDLAVGTGSDPAPFDESIFDIDDTDEFGRPVPGVFAQAQSLRRTANFESTKRQSDLTSRLSAHSCISRSTADTSPGEDNRVDKAQDTLMDKEAPVDTTAATIASSDHVSGGVHTSGESYQAALAAAAHQAVASGKFERASWLMEENGDSQDLTLSPDTNDDTYAHSTDGVSEFLGSDELDIDEDAIIAEANASALANDSDGWYGQEFGFYSSPLAQHHGGSQPSYEYMNGGYFGPKGLDSLDRSASGRMVSREPNLTPITERSEYSNRNSFMSLGLPSLSSPAPMVHSPGLAQLAMMPDRSDDEMTLSALLRLRSRAWGGSQASLSSSRDGSPRSERGEAASGSLWAMGNGRKPSTVLSTLPSIPNVGHNSEVSSVSESPTFASNTSIRGPQPSLSRETSSQYPQSSYVKDLQAWPLVNPDAAMKEQMSERRSVKQTTPAGEISAENGGPGTGSNNNMGISGPPADHRRHKSSSDSISYLREGQEDGETRWVVERRRTAESGEIEILGRQVVEGGRI